MIQMPRGRPAMSSPFIHGRTTSALLRPSGLGDASSRRAVPASMSNGPPLVSPMNEMPRFSRSWRALVRSRPELRSALIAATGPPFSVRSGWEPSSWPTKLMCTFAPARTQGSSAYAKKTSPVFLIRSRTRRFAPPRMPWVASSPARPRRWASICALAFSCQ